MRCPNCSFVCSDLRDICPKCLLDLRTHKKSLGLTVVNSSASYEELLKRVVKKDSEQTPKNKNVFSSLFKSFLEGIPSAPAQSNGPSRPAEQPPARLSEQPPEEHHLEAINSLLESLNEAPASSAPAPKITQEPAKFEPLQPPRNPEPPAPPEFRFEQPIRANESPQIDVADEIAAAEAQFTEREDKGQTSAPEIAAKPFVEPEVEALHEEEADVAQTTMLSPDPTQSSTFQEKEVGYTAMEEPVESAVFAFVSPPPEPPSPAEPIETPTHVQQGEDRVSVSQEPDPSPSEQFIPAPTYTEPFVAEQGSTLAASSAEEPEASVAFVHAVELPQELANERIGQDNGTHDIEIDALFLDALSSLYEAPAPDSLELSFEQFQDLRASEEVKLLFNLAVESVDNPDALKLLRADVVRSETRHVEAKSLEKQLKKVEKIMEAPALSLKSVSVQGKRDEALPDLPPPSPASLNARVLSAVVDAIFITMIALAGAAYYVYRFDQPFLALVLAKRELSTLDLIGPSAALLSALILATLLYPVTCHFIARRTIGMRVAKLALTRFDGKPATHTHAVLRGFLMPLSALFFGYLPLLIKRETLHDALARTRVVIARRTLLVQSN